MRYQKTARALVLTVAVGAAVFVGSRRKAPNSSQQHFLSHPAVEDDRTGQEVRRDFSDFMQELFIQEVSGDSLTLNFTLAEPERYGIREDEPTLGEYSLSELRKDAALTENELKKLHSFPYGKLTKEQKLEYDIIHTMLSTNLDGASMLEYSECLGPVTGIQAQLPVLLTEYRFYQRDDVERYLQLLEKVPDYFGQLLRFEQMKSERGLFMSDETCRSILSQCKEFIEKPEDNYLIKGFRGRLDRLEGLSGDQRTAYEEQNKKAVMTAVVPAYQQLIRGLEALQGTGTSGGLCRLPKGKAYYRYLVKAVTGSNRSLREIGHLLSGRLKQAQGSMSALLSKSPELMDEAGEVHYPCTDPLQTVQYLREQISGDFSAVPEEIRCEVKYVDRSLEKSLSPAMYLTPPIDRYRDNVVYLNRSEEYDLSEAFATIAHESYPGHLYQKVYFMSTEPDPIRAVINVGGYEEGWGTYAERTGYYLAGLKKGVDELLAENLIATLCLYAKADLEVNYNGWSAKRLAGYLKSYGYDASHSAKMYAAVAAEPVSYMQYTLGYIEIEKLKETARRSLRSRYTDKSFHDFFLRIGPAPFVVIQDRMNEWIDKQKKE